MSEITLSYNQWVKSIEFFPFQTGANLLAVCLKDKIKIYLYDENYNDQNMEINQFIDRGKAELKLITTISSTRRIDHFSWSKQTNLTVIKPTIQFAFCDSENMLLFHTISLAINLSNVTNIEKNNVMLNNFDFVYKIAYDHDKSNFLAYTADNFCFIWDCVISKIKAKIQLESPGIHIGWNSDETNRLMIFEKSGNIRVYNFQTCEPVYTLLSVHNRVNSLPLLNGDWYQANPSVVIANTSSDILIWNTSSSCIPDKLVQDLDHVKTAQLCQNREYIMGYVSGNAISSNLKIINYKTNDIVYQKKDIKLFKSFSFNSMYSIIAIANENKITVLKLLN